jgi:hypothetical protein
LRLIFYDEPTFGHYQGWFDAIFRDPRYTDLRANLQHFSAIYTTILAAKPPDGSGPQATAADRGAFENAYYSIISHDKTKLDEALRVLSAIPGQRS